MDLETFENCLDEAVQQLPEEFREALDNVHIEVQDWPDRDQLRTMRIRDRHELLGLYQGVPHTSRDSSYNLAMPDSIVLFRKPLEAHCSSEAELREAISDTLRHEIAHHFGTDEQTLRAIERRRSRHKNR